MKMRALICVLIAVMALVFLSGCDRSAAEAVPAEEEKIYVVPDADLPEDEYDPKIYGINPEMFQVEIPDEAVPLAPSYVDVSDGASEREAEAIAIHYAGLTNNDVRYLHSRFVEEGEAENAPYYHIEFRAGEVAYIIHVDTENGEVIFFEEG